MIFSLFCPHINDFCPLNVDKSLISLNTSPNIHLQRDFLTHQYLFHLLIIFSDFIHIFTQKVNTLNRIFMFRSIKPILFIFQDLKKIKPC